MKRQSQQQVAAFRVEVKTRLGKQCNRLRMVSIIRPDINDITI